MDLSLSTLYVILYLKPPYLGPTPRCGRETQGRGGGGRQFVSIDEVGIVQVTFDTRQNFVGGALYQGVTVTVFANKLSLVSLRYVMNGTSYLMIHDIISYETFKYTPFFIICYDTIL